MNPRRIPVLLVAVAAAALGGAGLAYSTSGPNTRLAHQDRIYGGGTYGPGCFVPGATFCIPNTRNLSIDAHAHANGKNGLGDVNYGTPGLAESHIQITCVAVHGNKGTVSGIITSSPTRPDTVGWWMTFFFVDLGTTAFGERDLASPAFVGPPDPTGNPPGYPFVCLSPETGAPDFGFTPTYLRVTGGDIVIQDATRGHGGDDGDWGDD